MRDGKLKSSHRKRRGAGRGRHPEFRPTGNQRSDALQRLALDAAKRRQREARAAMVYDWTNKPAGPCKECSSDAPRRLDGRPPIDREDLPHPRDVCLKCAGEFETIAREGREHGDR